MVASLPQYAHKKKKHIELDLLLVEIYLITTAIQAPQ